MAAKSPRHSIRMLVDFPVEIRGERGRFLGKARDLTATGVRLRVTTRLRPDERIGLTFKIPGTRDVEPWDFVGYVRWVTEPDEAGEMQAGVALESPEEMQKRLRNLLWKLEMGDAKAIERRHKTVRRVIPPKK